MLLMKSVSLKAQLIEPAKKLLYELVGRPFESMMPIFLAARCCRELSLVFVAA